MFKDFIFFLETVTEFFLLNFNLAPDNFKTLNMFFIAFISTLFNIIFPLEIRLATAYVPASILSGITV